MKDLIDNIEVEKVLNTLESLEDEDLAVTLLREFNDSTRELGQLLMNKDQNLDHDAWKVECDKAKERVDLILKKINSL